MIKTILLILVAAVAALLIYAATRPDSFKIERSTRIQASPEKVYALISELKAFNSWNPWMRKEPSAQLTYGPSTSGPGARYSWVGKESGEGSMEITEASPPSRVVFKLDFTKPFEAHNQALFTLTPDGSGTLVTWAMTGNSPYMHKVMGVIFNMDKMVGKDFEDGLANLKTQAEAR
jgi:uncharacterized protein YndB with AHSA1/START domain